MRLFCITTTHMDAEKLVRYLTANDIPARLEAAHRSADLVVLVEPPYEERARSLLGLVHDTPPGRYQFLEGEDRNKLRLIARLLSELIAGHDDRCDCALCYARFQVAVFDRNSSWCLPDVEWDDADQV